MRNYDFSGRQYQFEVKPSGVQVDYSMRKLSIKAVFSGYGMEPICQEFDLIRVRRCRTCGEPVSIQAAGSLRALETRTGKSLFPKPWEYGAWKLVKVQGGFALVASQGHNFKAGRYSTSEAACHYADLMDAEFGSEERPLQ